MEGRKFLYFVLNEDYSMFADFSASFLSWTSVPTPLTYTPDGWQDLSIIEEMDSKFFGLNRTYGTPQNFVEDGAGILKTVFYNLGYNAKINLLILEQQLYFSDTEYGYYYTELGLCAIDLTTYSHQSEKVVAQILEGDLKALFNAYESQQYEVPIAAPAAKNGNMSGLKLAQYANYLIQDPVDPNFRTNGNNLIGLELTSVEQKTQLGTQSIDRTRIDVNVDIFKSGEALLSNVPIDTDFTLDADFGMTVTLAPGVTPNPTVKYTLACRVFDKNGNIVVYPGNANLVFEVDGPNALYNHRIQVKGSVTFKILAGYSVFLWSGINVTNEGGGDNALTVFFAYDTTTSTGLDTDNNVTIQYFYIFKSTVAQFLEPLYIMQYLTGLISGGKYTAKSDFLTSLSTLPSSPTSLPYNLYTSGDGIRGLPGAVIKTSLDDFFKILNATYNLGLGIVNNVLVIEPKEFWVTSKDPEIDLGPGSKFQCDVWTDVLFNSIDIGSPNETYDEALGDINGKFEINMTHHYATPVTGINTILDLTTPARRDMYGAEYQRINLDGKTTSDSSADNDLFEIAFLPVPVGPIGRPSLQTYQLDRTINQFVTGLLDADSAFNLKNSPKHCLLRHGNYIRSVLHGMDLQKVTFTTSDKNTPMVTTYPSGLVVDERGNIEISNFAPRIFLPYIFTDTTPSTEASIQGDTVKKFSFSYLNGSIRARGTSLKTAVQPVDNRVQSMQLLASPDNVMTDFIDIWE